MGKLDWFHEARYGMFIHWGAYSVAARGEWVANRERIPLQEYVDKYVNTWKAENYDPTRWAELAKEAGMGYMVLTTRHHDGLALWDSKASDFNTAKMGPKRDLVAPYVEAARKAGLKVGLYYSPAAWYHPDYPGAHFRDWPGNTDWKDMDARIRFIEYYHAQLRELMTGYGKINLLWYDGCIPDNLQSPEINREIYALQPGILINPRNGAPYDFRVSEQTIRPAEPGVAWEACMTLNQNWGYYESDRDYKSAKDVIEMLLTTSRSAGNLLLNIGPKADGTVPEESVRVLKEAGAWLKRNREFLANSDRSPFTWNNMLLATTKGNRIYLHLKHDPRGAFCWAETKSKVLSAKFLATGQSIPFRQEGERLHLSGLPTPLPDAPLCTIVLEVEGKPEALTAQTTFWIPE